MQLESSSEIDNFVLRLGELHVVFTAFKMPGKIIDGSGLDKVRRSSDLWSNTVEHITDGHHLYRCFEGHQITIQKLWKVVGSHPLIEKGLREGIISTVTIIEN